VIFVRVKISGTPSTFFCLFFFPQFWGYTTWTFWIAPAVSAWLSAVFYAGAAFHSYSFHRSWRSDPGRVRANKDAKYQVRKHKQKARVEYFEDSARAQVILRVLERVESKREKKSSFLLTLLPICGGLLPCLLRPSRSALACWCGFQGRF
jgi:hypothetical protein